MAKQIVQGDPDVLTVREVAPRLGITADGLRKMIREGRFPPAQRLGGRRIVIPRRRFEAWLDGQAP